LTREERAKELQKKLSDVLMVKGNHGELSFVIKEAPLICCPLCGTKTCWEYLSDDVAAKNDGSKTYYCYKCYRDFVIKITDLNPDSLFQEEGRLMTAAIKKHYEEKARKEIKDVKPNVPVTPISQLEV